MISKGTKVQIVRGESTGRLTEHFLGRTGLVRGTKDDDDADHSNWVYPYYVEFPDNTAWPFYEDELVAAPNGGEPT